LSRVKGAPLDIHALHIWMWRTKTREGYLSVGMSELAENLGVALFSANRYQRMMVAQGRLKKLAQNKYIVVDPEKFLWEAKDIGGRRNQKGGTWFKDAEGNASRAEQRGKSAAGDTD